MDLHGTRQNKISQQQYKNVTSVSNDGFVASKQNKWNLLVVGEAAHDGRVDDAAEHHGQRVDGQRAVAGLLLHQVAQLLVGHLHGLHGVLQRTDLLLRVRTNTRA